MDLPTLKRFAFEHLGVDVSDVEKDTVAVSKIISYMESYSTLQ